MEIKVGQEIFVIGKYRYKKGETVKITKVGNKYFYINGDTRFFKDALKHDNGNYSSSIDIWESEQAYRDYIALYQIWDLLRDRVRNQYHPPRNLSYEVIKQAYDLLCGDNERE